MGDDKNQRTYNLIKILVCIAVVISIMVYNHVHPYQREYTVKDIPNILKHNEEKPDVDTELYDPMAADNTESDGTSTAYFLEASYKYLDQLEYNQVNTIMQSIRNYITDNIPDKIDHMEIEDGSFSLTSDNCNFKVKLSNKQLLNVKYIIATDSCEIQ